MTERILDKIIKPEFRAKLSDWEQYIKQSQSIGLEIIDQIYNSKGNKQVHIILPKQKVLYQTHLTLMNRKNHLSLEQAEQMYRRKQLTTTYQFHHGYSLSRPKKSNIFEYKTLQKLDLAKPLTAMAVSFIDNWLTARDKQDYQNYVLTCLRSIKAKVQISDAGSTEMRTAYNWRSDPKLSQPLRMDKICEDLFVFKPNVEAIRRQEDKQKKLRERIAEIEKTDFAKQLTIYKDFKIN